MKIVGNDQVDPLQALQLALLSADFSLTPEHAISLCRTDPRTFPFLTLNAVEGNSVLGQVGVFRLPMISTVGWEDVGGVCALSTYPQHAGRGIASRLLVEAHTWMREAGLRFSILRTNRSSLAYRLYQRHGYEDMEVWAVALARWETAHQPTRLSAQLPGLGGYRRVEKVFRNIARDYLGLARWHTPFTCLQEKVKLDEVWIVSENTAEVGFVFARRKNSLLKINVQLLRPGIDVAEAVASVVAELKAAYLQVTVSRPADILGLRHAGYLVAHPTWRAFMVSPLVPEVSIDDARRLFGIGTDRFLILW